VALVSNMLFCRAGGKAGAMQKCRTCNGRGVKITMRQLGPGMVQQMQSVCPDCHGEGRVLVHYAGRSITHSAPAAFSTISPDSILLLEPQANSYLIPCC
jgi:hypothetical protein